MHRHRAPLVSFSSLNRTSIIGMCQFSARHSRHRLDRSSTDIQRVLFQRMRAIGDIVMVPRRSAITHARV